MGFKFDAFHVFNALSLVKKNGKRNMRGRGVREGERWEGRGFSKATSGRRGRKFVAGHWNLEQRRKSFPNRSSRFPGGGNYGQYWFRGLAYVHVGNIHPKIVFRELAGVFDEVARVRDWYQPRKLGGTGAYKFGFFRFRLKEEATEVIRRFNGTVWDGCPLKIGWANTHSTHSKMGVGSGGGFRKVEGKGGDQPRSNPQFQKRFRDGRTYAQALKGPTKGTSSIGFDICGKQQERSQSREGITSGNKMGESMKQCRSPVDGNALQTHNITIKEVEDGK